MQILQNYCFMIVRIIKKHLHILLYQALTIKNKNKRI